MLKRIALFVAVAGLFLAVIFASNGDAETPEKKLAVPEMKFNDVKEIAFCSCPTQEPGIVDEATKHPVEGFVAARSEDLGSRFKKLAFVENAGA